MGLKTLVAFPFDPAQLQVALNHLTQEWQTQGIAIFYAPNTLDQLPSNKEYLSVEELQELSLMSLESRQKQFLTSRWILKSLLSELLQRPAKEILFTKGALGKPALANPEFSSLSLDFNISHKTSISLIGLTNRGQIGVDVEELEDNAKAMQIAERYFHTQELDWIRQGETQAGQLQEGLNHSSSARRFYQMWSLKESLIKAVGGGMFQNLNEFYLKLSAKDGFEIISQAKPWNQVDQWNLFDVKLPSHAVGAASILQPPK